MFEYQADWLIMFNAIHHEAPHNVLGLYHIIYSYEVNTMKANYNALQLASLTNEYKEICWRMNSNYIYGKMSNLSFSWYLSNNFGDAASLTQKAYNSYGVTYYWLAF